MHERNEKMMWEQYHISRMDEADLDLREIKQQLGDKKYGKLMRFFKNVAKNTVDALKDSQIYITLESFGKKLKQHMGGGPKMDFMAQRMFMVMTDNMSAKRIYFKDFVAHMLSGLMAEEVRMQNLWAFKMADVDHNGLLNGVDLLTVQDNIESTSEYAEELQIVVNHFVRTHLLTRDLNSIVPSQVMTGDLVTVDKYTSLLQGDTKKSCLIEDFKNRIL